MNKHFLTSIVIVLVIVGVVTMIFLIRNPKAHFEYSQQVIPNPLMGYAPKAEHSDVGEDVTLVYVDVTWAELEPEEGVYNWEAVEKEKQWVRWRTEGKHVVLRFVVDYPRSEIHKDIPEWLYDKMDHEGDWYDMEYGKGFSPNYAHPTFIEKHRATVVAMGERWGQDTFISYVELGSIGHWGEWHVNFGHGIRRLPNEAIRNQYVIPWLTAFPHAKLLMRRPFGPAKEYQLGLFNDMTGEPKSTMAWLDWIQSGGVYDQTGETNAIVAIPEVWRKAPIGGEFTSAIAMKELMSASLGETIELIRQSHMTFIGPKTAEPLAGTTGYEDVLKNIGYRLWISKAELNRQSDQTIVTLQWQNSGVAPFYFDWQTQLVLLDHTGKRIKEIPIELDWAQLQPNAQVTTKTAVDEELVGLLGRMNYTVAVEIVDPMTEAAAVHFAVKGQEDKPRLILFK